MTPFQKRIGAPAFAGVTIATLLMALDDSFGPPPKVLPFRYGAVVVHIPWLLSLVLIGALATFLARRKGANLGQQVMVALSPAFVIGGAVNVLMAIVITSAHLGGHHVHPIDFIGHFIIGWLVLPAGALLIGSLPSVLDHVRRKVAGMENNDAQIKC